MSESVSFPEAFAPPMDICDAVYTALSSDNPGIRDVRDLVRNSLNLSDDGARGFLYDTIAGLNTALFPPVTHLELIHTEGCNLGCSYCFEKDMLGFRRMKPEVARAAVKLLFDYSGDASKVSVVHFGGEPTMNMPGIKLVTEYA